MKRSVRCTYLSECYLAEDLKCYGFKTDCPLYMKVNGEDCNQFRFDAAMDGLIKQAKDKHDRLSVLGEQSEKTAANSAARARQPVSKK